MTHTYKNLNELVDSLKSGFESLDLIGVYEIGSNRKIWYHNSGKWDIDVLASMVSKGNFTNLGFKQFKIDYSGGGIFLLSELKSGIWLVLGTSEKIYAQINLFLRQVSIESVEIGNTETVPAGISTKAAPSEDPFFQKLNAARRLQHSILPKREVFNKIFPKTVIYYQPQDVIGGDIYWVKEFDNEIYVVVADCTGHSVEGALASMTVHSLLSDIIQKGLSPKQIGASFFERLDGYKIEDEAYSIGVEIGIVRYDKKKKSISYLSTGIPIILQQKGVLDVKKLRNRFDHNGSPMEIAIGEDLIKMNKADKVFMFTDGLIDLFDKDNAKKLGMKGVKDMTEKLTINGSFNDEYLTKMLDQWKGTTEQIDDITFLAIEF